MICHDLLHHQKLVVRLFMYHYPKYTTYPYTGYLSLDICSCVFFMVYPPASASQPSPGDKSPERGRAVRKNRTTQKLPIETQSSNYAPGLSTPSYLSSIIAQPPVIPLLPKATFIKLSKLVLFRGSDLLVLNYF